MPSWNELLTQLGGIKDPKKGGEWLSNNLTDALKKISGKRNDNNVIFYASSFLQKPQIPAYLTQITHEDINGFMSVMYGMDWNKDLTIVLHTPGGITNATQTIVDYLHSKFDYIEVIIPTMAMSAGTMISLSANNIIMGKQSQLGPIDPQFNYNNRSISARAVVSQFKKAKNEILSDPKLAHLWAPIVQSLGPSLLKEAENALDYGEIMVAEWLKKRMFHGDSDADKKSKSAAEYFNRDDVHKSHGRRINRDEARAQGLIIEDLEPDQDFQDHVLTAYHLGTLIFEKSPCSKFIHSSTDKSWIKNIGK